MKQHKNWEDHDFKKDPTRTHGKPKLFMFGICACGEKAQVSLSTGQRFTTARQKKDINDVKKSAGLKTSRNTKIGLKERGFRSEQDFFDYCYFDLDIHR